MISSLILFFLGFLYSYYFHKDGQKNYEITVFTDGSFGEEKIFYFYIWNSGKTTIYKEDLLDKYDGINVYFKNNFFIEYAKITDQTSQYFNLEVFQNYKDVKIKFDLLRPDEGFTLMIKGNQKLSRSSWELPIKQKKDVLKFPNRIKARGTNSNFHLFNNILHFIVLGFTLFSYFFLNKINLDGFVSYFQLVVYIGLSVFLIYIIPVLFGRIKASHPPHELKLHFIEKNNGK